MEFGVWRRCSDMSNLRLSKKWKRRLAIWAGVLGVLFLWSAYPWVYWADPIKATVVDAQTKQPVEGVIVVAMWVLKGGMHRDEVGFLEVLETVTDAEGRFYFDGWGPMRRPRWGILNTQDPEIFLFKDGYRFERLLNEHQGQATKGAMGRRSTWNGKTIPLERFEGEIKEYAQSLSYLSSRIHLVAVGSLPHRSCEWQKIPMLMLAVEEVERRRKLANPRSIMRLVTTQSIHPIARCGSADEYFGKFRP